MAKPQRIRDPIHDLIEFSTDDLEQLAWKIVNCREFQRLRRVKQLGFSELVFPGATHTRFAHSVGVFHTARQLVDLIANRAGEIDPSLPAQTAVIAALVHDLGHGPFSHAFEKAMTLEAKNHEEDWLGKRRHEDWTAEIVQGDTQVSRIFNDFSKGFGANIAKVLLSETPLDIYSAVVSSQFDADRLDYLRRDRVMAGVSHGGFDFSWLLANLEIGTIPLSVDGEVYEEARTLVLGPKALQAAEAFVLGLFHMYFAVYFHKGTRSAECMLAALLGRIGALIRSGDVRATGLSEQNPIVRYLVEPSLESYLRMDDFVIWASLHEIESCEDRPLRELGCRLLNRRLYKAVDISQRFEGRGDAAAETRFKAALFRARQEGRFGEFDVFEDTTARNPYQRRGYGTQEALDKVYINRGGGPVDLSDVSDVVKNLKEKSTFRVYTKNNNVRDAVLTLVEETP